MSMRVKSDAVLLCRFLKDAGSVTAIMFSAVLGYAFFMNLDFSLNCNIKSDSRA